MFRLDGVHTPLIDNLPDFIVRILSYLRIYTHLLTFPTVPLYVTGFRSSCLQTS